MRVWARPGASRNAIEGVGEDADGRSHLRIRVRAVAEDGKANRAVCALLASAFDVPRSAVSVEAGATSRLKTIVIEYPPAVLAQRLAKATGEAHDGPQD